MHFCHFAWENVIYIERERETYNYIQLYHASPRVESLGELTHRTVICQRHIATCWELFLREINIFQVSFPFVNTSLGPVPDTGTDGLYGPALSRSQSPFDQSINPNNDFQRVTWWKRSDRAASVNVREGGRVTPCVVFMKRQYFVFAEYEALKV